MTAVGTAFLCDCCDRDLNNGSLYHCVVVSRITDAGLVENLHFCNDYTDEQDVAVKGCASKMLSAARLAAYREREGEGAA